MNSQNLAIISTALLLFIQISCLAEEPRKIALLVGVSDYFDKNMEDLNYAENDVNVIARELKQLGFVVSKVTGQSATKSIVESSVQEFMKDAATLANEDIVFVMFSGHGQELRVQQTNTVLIDGKERSISKIGEVPFFCPRDAVPFDVSKHSLRGKMESEIADEFNVVSLNGVIGLLDSRSNSLRNLLVVDACRNNPGKGRSANITGSTTRELPRGLSILFAAKSGQKSWESSDGRIKHGVMSYYLIEGLRGKAKDDRNEITWGDLTNFVKKSVIRDRGKLAGGSDRIQNPHTISSSDDVIVLGKSMEQFSKSESKSASEMAKQDVKNSLTQPIVQAPINNGKPNGKYNPAKDGRFEKGFAAILNRTEQPFRDYLMARPNKLESLKLIDVFQTANKRVAVISITSEVMKSGDEINAEKICGLQMKDAMAESSGVLVESLQELNARGQFIEEIKSWSKAKVRPLPMVAKWKSADGKRVYVCYGKLMK